MQCSEYNKQTNYSFSFNYFPKYKLKFRQKNTAMLKLYININTVSYVSLPMTGKSHSKLILLTHLYRNPAFRSKCQV